MIFESKKASWYVFAVVAICSISFVLLNGCAGNYIINKTEAIHSETLNDDNSGIIIGRVTLQTWYGVDYGLYEALKGGKTVGISFARCDTGEETTYVAGHYFFLRLPEGCYKFLGIGSRAGAFMPVSEPFKFTVTNGTIKYIGSFVGDQDLEKKIRSLQMNGGPTDNVIFSKAVYAVKPNEPITFYVIDERDAVIEEFQKKFPEYKNKEITFDFMK